MNTIREEFSAEDGVEPVTIWLRRLEEGDPQAAQMIWSHFCSRILEMAKNRVPTRVRTGYDADDVANSAFHSLFLGIADKRFDLRNRSDLWRLLVTIAERKISHRVRHECRDKRDIRRLVHESVFLPKTFANGKSAPAGMDTLVGAEPSPAFVAEMTESFDALLQSLPDESLRQVALLRMENNTADEIAKRLGITRRTVQRKLLVIRETWRDAAGIRGLSDNEMSQLDAK